MRFESKTAIVTGGASGIGAATTRLLLDEGANVVVVDRSFPGSDRSAATDRYREEQCDVSDAAACEEIVARTIERLGGIDVLVTSAGISRGQPLVETEEAMWDEVFAVNVKGTFLWMRSVLPHMVSARAGAIVTIASQLAFAGGRNNAAYIASKGAIVSLTKTASLEHACDGVRINAVAPGATETPMLLRSFARHADAAAARQRASDRHAMKRLGKPEEIAEAIAYLACDQASFITGTVLPVDGGWLAA